MLIQLLFTNPILFFLIGAMILFVLAVHEYSHALAANYLGDPTAKNAGRLTVNPIAHLDPMGTILLFCVGIGWGKPVPINPFNFRNQKWGSAIVGAAGPASNFLMAIIAGLLLRFFELPNPGLVAFASIFIWLNIILGVFNLLPVPPLDGSHIFLALLPSSAENIKIFLLRNSLFLVFGALFFMYFVGFPLICEPLFTLIAGAPSPF